MSPKAVQLFALCAAMGIDLDDIIKRANGECICGHMRDEHGDAEATACAKCGCGGFVIPPKVVRDGE